MQIRDGLRPSRCPRRTLHEARFEEPVSAAVLEVVVPEPDIGGTNRIHEGGYGADGAGRGRGGRGGGGGRGGEGALAELVQGLHA